VVLEVPIGVGFEPVVEVAIKGYFGVVAYPGLSEELFKLFFREDVSLYWMVEVFAPVEEDRAWNVSELVVCYGVVVYFDDAYFGVVEVLLHPFGADSYFGMCV